MKNSLFYTDMIPPDARALWDGMYKIPWNDPAFSGRILAEHLSQDHHLASRKLDVIESQVAWINANVLTGVSASILDLGCGPGLYSRCLAGVSHRYVGLDFSPASIDHARQEFGVPGRCEFRLGDVVEADLGGPFDLVMMLYGELNVFSPDQCRRILVKAFEALAPGGRLLVERQRVHAVQAVGQGVNTWTRAESGGLFAEAPYVCLTENHWFQEEGVSLQCFQVWVKGQDAPVLYRSTTKAWTASEMEGLFRSAGFIDVVHHSDWPVPDQGLALVSGRKG
ncbi:MULTISPECIES: class I SAM-dependent methyltransferase [unclassified Pseudodesulfovibrio]|uniref:class I SAM-dependent methyltransferase n=1 Tax=unclassified Pseudodesulfovibrio TaxID=2661612 RepID=UPI000FEBA5C5|nr:MULTISPECIES: class I SAM-dependent methyltransferase [unclassified Pseudodesulfovibrio]MCJ2165951.1 class I SAM-dependent methyltransferase [Pseudodesulfovibrio sp. S3-i]RWU02626.1 class I SAM-dependent methyltransferase [Pseudodesulfovibrio sp. S3]